MPVRTQGVLLDKFHFAEDIHLNQDKVVTVSLRAVQGNRERDELGLQHGVSYSKQPVINNIESIISKTKISHFAD